ncbi:nucleotidyltransferase family protein [Prevotella sp.]|uniref:nucleotidyltransferase family protein n=1 Tax=Prevotella sp. TaxID=59823 RepID=UPI001CB40BC5|nr:sugar phosphate nucleotidyltransferase [Prevotella sp.]MBF1616765.1 NTP transferase domain-containing protein [Prevotella sp.]
MKFAIIAAGDGSRLAQEGVTEPKPLVKVRGERLIDRLIRIFMGNNATEIVVICNEQMSDVASHLKMIQDKGLNGLPVPLRFVVKSTPSSMHSFYELRNFLRDDPFILTTVDTIFDESEFHDYVLSFQDKIAQGTDALMGVTDYIDDEKPLYVGVDNVMRISGYYDTPQADSHFISAGIYGLTAPSLNILEACIEKGESRMRNFQRALVADGLQIEAYPLTKVFDIDHIDDIRKADEGVNNLSSCCKGKTLLIQRAACYSPNSEEKDLAILQEVGCLLEDATIISEDDFVNRFSTYNQSVSSESVESVNAYCQIISMARSTKALDSLEQLEQSGIRVLNPSVGVWACQRSNVDKVMRENYLPLPPDKGDDGYWVKRADTTAQSKEDVCFCHDWSEVEKIKSTFMQRGITDVVTQAHVKGDVVKFYGVEGTGFFRYYYSGDDTETKFGDEERNGKPQYYSFSSSNLQADAEKLACLLQTPIYGGDAIVREDGSYVIIDFNDFPSFSRCRKEAAKAIVGRMKQKVEASRKTSLNEKCKDDMNSRS